MTGKQRAAGGCKAVRGNQGTRLGAAHGRLVMGIRMVRRIRRQNRLTSEVWIHSGSSSCVGEAGLPAVIGIGIVRPKVHGSRSGTAAVLNTAG